MPRKKKPDGITDLEKARLRVEKAKQFVSSLSDDFIKKANAGKLSQEQFNKAAQALRSIVTDSHLTGIRVTTPKLRVETLDGSNLVIKISIGTAKTRKSFSIRRRL